MLDPTVSVLDQCLHLNFCLTISLIKNVRLSDYTAFHFRLLGYKKNHSKKFFLFINVKMPTPVGILKFMSRNNFMIGLSEAEKKLNFLIFLYL